ncbi:MAG TPA: AraC family transcriptional regulator, partial [candidate division Zixibacteria bacterium]|nr:AraC family transcriptional regulator [candidate division Zixibacteria bacterium]
LSYGGPDVMEKIPMLWAGLMERREEIEAIDNAGTAYGITIMAHDTESHEDFQYVAGYKVLETENVPEDMAIVRIDAGKYAVFTHHGLLATIGQTIGYIYGVWAQTNGEYELRDAPQFEWYGEKFNPMGEDSQMEIYIPVSEKAAEYFESAFEAVFGDFIAKRVPVNSEAVGGIANVPVGLIENAPDVRPLDIRQKL